MRRGGLTVVLVGGHKPAVAMGDGGPDGIFPGRSAKVVLERRLGTRYVALLQGIPGDVGELKIQSLARYAGLPQERDSFLGQRHRPLVATGQVLDKRPRQASLTPEIVVPALIRDLGGLLRKPASTLHILHVAREPRGSRECSEDPHPIVVPPEEIEGLFGEIASA